MIELGQPEQLPFNSTVTTPFLKDLNVISPPSLATAGLIFASKTSLILLIISSDCFGVYPWADLAESFFTTTSFPFE